MEEIKTRQNNLTQHPVYQSLNSIENLRLFMESHVFAVWDFMSLLKSLQKKVTCVDLPWRPSIYPEEMVRLVNEIVLGEESDVDENNKPISHFNLYLEAMREIGADTTRIELFLKTFEYSHLFEYEEKFVKNNIDIAMNEDVLSVAASFFYGREKLIPSMFESIVKLLEEEKMNCPKLIYYLKRHIFVDSEDHGPKAMKFLNYLINDDKVKLAKVISVATSSLHAREELWDGIQKHINSQTNNLKQAHTQALHPDEQT